MDRLFLDANVLFSAAFSRTSRVRDLWKLRGVQLVTSEYAAEEARRNLDTDVQRAELTRLMRKMNVTRVAFTNSAAPLPISLPEKDRPIFRAAVEGECTHLLTGDHRHFGAYFGRIFAGARVQPPAMYIREHRRRSAKP